MPRATRAQFVWRGFNVDTQPPAGADDHRHRPQLAGQRQRPRGQGHGGGRHDREALQDGGLHRHPAGVRSAANFASPGITASVPDNTTTAFRARAVDAAGNLSACSGARYYVEDSTP